MFKILVVIILTIQRPFQATKNAQQPNTFLDGSAKGLETISSAFKTENMQIFRRFEVFQLVFEPLRQTYTLKALNLKLLFVKMS